MGGFDPVVLLGQGRTKGVDASSPVSATRRGVLIGVGTSLEIDGRSSISVTLRLFRARVV